MRLALIAAPAADGLYSDNHPGSREGLVQGLALRRSQLSRAVGSHARGRRRCEVSRCSLGGTASLWSLATRRAGAMNTLCSRRAGHDSLELKHKEQRWRIHLSRARPHT